MKNGIRHTQSGVTLLELMVTMGVFTVVMGILFSLSLSIGDTARIQDTQMTSNDEARRALLAVVPRLRQAQNLSINRADLPGDVLSFRMAEDVNGNGTAVDIGAKLEVGDLVTIQRDVNDVNGDGRTMTQLVMLQGDTATVLANNLSPDVLMDGNGATTAGFWAEEESGGVRLTIRTQGTSRRGHVIREEFTVLVNPRN